MNIKRKNGDVGIMGFEIVVVNKKRCKCGDYHFDFIVDGKTIDDGRFGMAAGNRFALKLGSAIGREFDTYSMVQTREVVQAALVKYNEVAKEDLMSANASLDVFEINPRLTVVAMDIKSAVAES